MYSANTMATMVLAVILMFWISTTLSIYVLLPVPGSPAIKIIPRRIAVPLQPAVMPARSGPRILRG